MPNEDSQKDDSRLHNISSKIMQSIPHPNITLEKHEYTYIPKHIQTILAGGLAGCISKTCTAPLERVQMLNQTGAAAKSIRATLGEIYAKDSVLGFWKGNFANCVRIFPHKSLLFSVNDYLKSIVPSKSSSMAFITGAIAGSVATAATYPIDLIRANLAGTFDEKNASIRKVVQNVYKSNGFLGFYRGLAVTLLGAFPYESARIGVYTVTRDYIPTVETYYGDQPHPIGKLCAGAFAGACAAVTTYPSDTIRRMLQIQGSDNLTQYNGVIHCITDTWKKHGIMRFYSGISAKLVRVVPDAAILFLAYEYMKDHFEHIYFHNNSIKYHKYGKPKE